MNNREATAAATTADNADVLRAQVKELADMLGGFLPDLECGMFCNPNPADLVAARALIAKVRDV